jgi:hypothetical protein
MTARDAFNLGMNLKGKASLNLTDVMIMLFSYPYCMDRM